MAERVFNEENRNLRANQGLSTWPHSARTACATLRDLDALSHRSDQGRRATDVCLGAAAQARVLPTHVAKGEGNEGEQRKRAKKT